LSGQPAVHFPHWEQCDMITPVASSTCDFNVSA
jgi:hypothetical protein